MGGRIVGIGGRLGAGKDAVADYLVGKGWVKVGMSDVLHECAMKLNPIVPINLNPYNENYLASNQPEPYVLEGRFARYRTLVDQVGYVEAKKNPEVRRFLQVFGTEIGRNMFGEDFWVDIMERRLRKLATSNDVIVTGIRFPNELEMVVYLKGTTWWVDRDTVVTSDSHSSENSVNAADFDIVIPNTGTLEDLYHEVDIYR